MIHKTIVSISVLLLAALALSGCTKDVHGGGRVTLLDVPGGQPGEATIGLSFICNEGKDAIRGTLAWNDQTNGVSFIARLPWTPVAEVFDGIATCEEAAAIADAEGASVNVAIINTQGQESGMAAVAVGEPGVAPECGSESPVIVQAEDASFGSYAAFGCLDRGNIVFQ